MASFTVFFCGTGSNSYDFAHTAYFAGELVSTLAMHHTGHEFVDWIIVDGPGSGNLQEAEKWVPSGNYSQTRGTLSGKGWDENVKHAVAVLVGSDFTDRREHTRKEVKLLRKMGVGVHTEERQGRIGRTLLGTTKQVQTPLHARITPQALQQKKVEILGQHKVFDVVNVIGWSRGGVTCHMFANALAETHGWSHMPVNIFAADPVPGSGNFQTGRITLGPNVKNYVAIYSADERSRGFSPVLPQLSGGTRHFITTMPGRHATLVGNAAVDGSNGVNTMFGPGKVTRDLAEKFLTAWGTPLDKRLHLSDGQILAYYDEMMGKARDFESMHDVSYTGFTQKGLRSVGLGDGTWADLGAPGTLPLDPVFVNSHHRWLFAQRYAALYNALFENRKLTAERARLEMFNMKMMYPNLHKRLSGIPIGLTD